MDPVLAARFAKLREKQDAGESDLGEIGSAANRSLNLDPVLAKRWAKQQQCEEAGESIVDLDVIESKGSDAKPWEAQQKECEFAKRWAKVAENVEAAVTELEDESDAPVAKPVKSELAALLAARLGKQRAISFPEDEELNDTETEANGKTGLVQAGGREEIAARTHLHIRAGDSSTHTVSWSEDEAVSPAYSLQWSIVALEDLTIDLEVSAVLRGGKRILLQKNARGGTFNGRFTPTRDRRVEAGVKVDKIMFVFSNSFSWFNGKDVEIITLCS